MRRPAVYYSNKGIYFGGNLIFSTSIIKLTTQCHDNANIPPDKVLGGLYKSKQPRKDTRKYAKPTRGLKIKKSRVKYHTHKPHSIVLGGSKLQYIAIN